MCIALLTTSCQQSAPTPPAPPPAPAQTAPIPPPGNELSAAARELLDRAEHQLTRHQLTSPAGDNALATYAQVLEVDKGPAAQDEVRHGRERVVEAYLGLAESALTNPSTQSTATAIATAHAYLAQATAIDADHPGIAPMRKRLALIAASIKTRIPLDAAALRARNSTLVQQLQKIGIDAKAKRALVTIFARSDEEGRWIYRQLSSATGDVRLRAEIRRGSTPALQVLYLDNACNTC